MNSLMFRNMSDSELMRAVDRIDRLPREALEDLARCLADRVQSNRQLVDTALDMVKKYERLDSRV